MMETIEKYTHYDTRYDSYLGALEKRVKKSLYLPKHHLYPKTGLMNDPNGLSYFNGEYHVFYQWYPFGASHGMKHWGHAASSDLVDFSDQGYGLIPDQEYEKNGAYSGNAIEHEGQLYLFYTANYKTDTGKKAKQALAIMDQKGNIVKHHKNPIIDGAPEGFSQELRDPFVFKRHDHFYMLLGGGSFTDGVGTGFGDVGELLLYQSDNLLDWAYLGPIEVAIPRGYMLECPSMVRIGEKDVLFLSPMGYEREEHRYHNRFASIYLVGNLDLSKRVFHIDEMDELDAGFDYYAPQSFLGEKQEPLTMGWFGCGEQVYPIDDEGWKHGLTMPQKMTLKENRLYRYPVQSLLKRYKKDKITMGKRIDVSDRTFLLETRLDESTLLRFGREEDYWSLCYNQTLGQITIDRSSLKQPIDREQGEQRHLLLKDKTLSPVLSLFVDNSFVELYVNQGEQVMSFRVFLENGTNQIVSDTEITTHISYFS